MNLDFNKVFNISCRVSFAICIACVGILFFPSKWLPFDVTAFRQENGLWIFFVFIFSVAVMFSYLGQTLCKKVSVIMDKRKTWSTYKYILKNLSDDEKTYLKTFYVKKQTAILLDLTNPVVKKLQTFQVLSMSTGTSLALQGMAPGFIQPWVFEIIDKHPEYLRTSEEHNHTST